MSFREPARSSRIGAGTTILTADNTYAGGTTINAGTLQLGNGGTSGSIIGNVVNNGTLAVNRSNAYQFDGVVSGAGNVTQAGTGTTIFTNAQTYTGGTTINAGTLQLGNGGATGSVVGNVLNNGTLAFNRSNTYQFDGLVSGTGSVIQAGTGTTIFTSAQTYTGGTTINSGVLSVGIGGTTGSIVGDVTLMGGSLVFSRSDAYQFDGEISGTGGTVETSGVGPIIFTGTNTYTNLTAINSGSTLQLGNGGATGSIDGNVINNGTLAFNRSNAYQFDGVISGAGALRQNGAGTTILTADNTYGGGTTINAGTLQLGNGGATGSIAGNVHQ